VVPLGTVLLPGQVLPLHIFELRYRVLMRELTAPDAVPEFGVVLIERGHEVGGGDERVAVGTVARVAKAQELADGRWMVAAAGTTRFRVGTWLPDQPYPCAEIVELPDEADPDAGDAAWTTRASEAERLVRRALALATELGDPSGSSVARCPSAPSTGSGCSRSPDPNGWSC
jgi:Lon protease-like protein